MKKTITAMAVAAAMAAPMAASADATVYGKVNAAVTQVEKYGADSQWGIDYSSDKGSAVGVKGSADTNLMDFSAVYKAEIGFYDMMKDDGTATQLGLRARDTWVGLSSKSMGTLRAGTIKTAYKASGGYIDPFWDTDMQGRGDLEIMSSRLHGGSGDGRGRQTNSIQYTSPKIAGANVIVDYNMAEGKKDNMGVGVHYKNGPILAFVDYVSQPEQVTAKSGVGTADVDATKIGGKYTAGDVAVALQYEIDGGAISQTDGGEANTLFFNATYNMGATALSLSYGMQDESTSNAKDDHSGFAVGAIHSIAKTTALYAAYGSVSGGDGWGDSELGAITSDDDATILSIGMQHAF